MSRRVLFALIPIVLVITAGVPWMRLHAARADLDSALEAVTCRLPDPTREEVLASAEHPAVELNERLVAWHAQLVEAWPECESNFGVLRNREEPRWSEVESLRSELVDITETSPPSHDARAYRHTRYRIIASHAAVNLLFAQADAAASRGLIGEAHQNVTRAFFVAHTLAAGAASNIDLMISCGLEGRVVRDLLELANKYPALAREAATVHREDLLSSTNEDDLIRVFRMDLSQELDDFPLAESSSRDFDWNDLGSSERSAVEDRREELVWLAKVLNNPNHEIDHPCDLLTSRWRGHFVAMRRAVKHSKIFRRHGLVMLALLEARENGRRVESLSELDLAPVIMASSRIETETDGVSRNLVVAEPFASRFGLRPEHTSHPIR